MPAYGRQDYEFQSYLPEDPPKEMRQYAPYPMELHEAVRTMKYQPGYAAYLFHEVRDPADTHKGEAGGLTLSISVPCYNSYNPEEFRPVRHIFPVPAATYNTLAWKRWILDCICQIHQHEACEWLSFDGERPFAPTHGPGDNPYVVVHYASDEQRRTSFRGEVNPE